MQPVQFTIRAEKCPNRRGVESVLQRLQGEVVGFATVVNQPMDALWFTGGYPNPDAVNEAIPDNWTAPKLLVVQDLFHSKLTKSATTILPATTAFEKDGTFVNHSGLAQSFVKSIKAPVEVRSELQLGYDLAGKKGLATVAAVRKDLAKELPQYASLEIVAPAKTGSRLELATV